MNHLLFLRYRVNIWLSRIGESAPVIFETNPTYSNVIAASKNALHGRLQQNLPGAGRRTSECCGDIDDGIEPLLLNLMSGKL